MILTFTHSNYMQLSGGTEKFIRELSGDFLKRGIIHVVIFPIRRKLLFCKYIGVIVNDKFIGVYNIKRVFEVVDDVCIMEDAVLQQVIVQHTLGFDLRYISDCINHFRVDTVFFVHDLHFICNSVNMIDSFGKRCEKDYPNKLECEYCAYHLDAVKCYDYFKKMITDLDDLIYRFVCPSEVIMKKMICAFPNLKNKTIIREHNVFSGLTEYEISNYPMKIAFCGVQANHKGYEEWCALCDELCDDDRFELLYLGNGRKTKKNIKSVYVDVASQGDDAMYKAISDNEIDCGFVWSLCPESYSFVYDEMAVNGVFVLTNRFSGNVMNRVLKNKNGFVFDSLDAVIQSAKTGDLKRKVDEYRCCGSFKPQICCFNSNISDFICFNSKKVYDVAGRSKKTRKNVLLSWAYRMKHS